MFVLRNAWAQLMRHKPRTLLTLLIALLAAFGTLFGWSVQQANTTATTTDRESLAPAAVVRLTAAQQAKYDGADKAWVKNYLTTDDYNSYYSIVTENSITLATVNASSSIPVRQTKDSVQAIAGTADQDADKTGGELTLKSFTSVETARDNELGRYTVVEGKHLSYSGNAPKGALISKKLAQKNNLKVGDEITVASPSDASKTTTLTVRGIYEYTDANAPSGHGDDAKLSKDNRDNTIYVAYATMYETKWANESASDWSKPDLSYVFSFSSMADYTKYQQKVASKIDKKHALGSPTIDAYERKIEPLTTLASRLHVALVASIAAILLLAVVLWSVSRRSAQIGAALVAGMTRGRLAWQFMLETLIPVGTGLALGLLAAGFGSKHLGAALAGGYETAVTGSLVWRSIWSALGVLIALMIVAALRVAFFRTSSLFAARSGWTVDDEQTDSQSSDDGRTGETHDDGNAVASQQDSKETEA